jgi:hypothetical protein
MASSNSLAAACQSLIRFLNRCFDDAEPVADSNTTAVLANTLDLRDFGNGTRALPALTVFLCRVDFNKATRAAWSARGHLDGRAHLPLDLHVLLTPWAVNALDECRVLGRAMQCLEETPILSGPILHPGGDWDPVDSLQIVLEEVSTEAVMRTFDSLPLDYRLSVPYVMRVLRIDGRETHQAPAVTSAVTRWRPEVEVS